MTARAKLDAPGVDYTRASASLLRTLRADRSRPAPRSSATPTWTPWTAAFGPAHLMLGGDQKEGADARRETPDLRFLDPALRLGRTLGELMDAIDT